MSQEPNIWYVRGTIHNADGSVFYNQGRIMAYHVIPQSGWEWIAEADIDSNTGAFELEFHTSNFQKLDFPPIDLPKLQIRVTDYDNNPLWISDIYTAPTAEMNVGDIVVNGGANEVWNVCGIICDSDNSPYTVGSIKVFDVRNEVENELGSCQLNQEGFYSVNYTTGMFQQGDTSIERPNLLVRVYSSDESVVQSIEGPNVATNFEIINIEVPAQESGGDSGSSSDCDCKIYGTIKNTLNYPLKDNIEVAAFCLYQGAATALASACDHRMRGQNVRQHAFQERRARRHVRRAKLSLHGAFPAAVLHPVRQQGYFGGCRAAPPWHRLRVVRLLDPSFRRSREMECTTWPVLQGRSPEVGRVVPWMPAGALHQRDVAAPPPHGRIRGERLGRAARDVAMPSGWNARAGRPGVRRRRQRRDHLRQYGTAAFKCRAGLLPRGISRRKYDSGHA